MAGVGETHDVSLGGHLYRLAANGYRRRPAPLRGARVAGGDFGWGDLSVWQRWHQFTWNGGMGADKWVDDAMYDFAVGMDTTVKDQVSISRGLHRSDNSDLTANDVKCPKSLIVYASPDGNDRLLMVTRPDREETFGSAVFRYDDAADKWDLIKRFGSGWKARSVVKFSGELAIGFINGKIRRTTKPAVANSWKTTVAPRKVRGKPVQNMAVFGGKLYCAYGDAVYKRKQNWKVEGKKVFYNPAGNAVITAMEEHLGFLYMGSKNGHIHRTDGNVSFDIWRWDGGTQINALRSFDGRLFVSTYEYEDDADLGVNGIYQFTGAAVTQLKRWGKRQHATIGGDFTVHAGKLFYGAPGLWGYNVDDEDVDQGGFGVAVFDPIEDAHSIWATNRNPAWPDASGVYRDWIVDDIIFWRGHLHAATRKHGVFRVEETYRDYVDGTVLYDVDEVSPGVWTGGGSLTSSIYDGGTPGLAKQWREMVLTCWLPESCSASLDYSLDGGDTWALAGTVTGDVSGPSRRESFLLPPTSRSPSIRYRLRMHSSEQDNSPIVTGVTVAYLPVPEPNWLWDIQITLADRQQLLDRTDEAVDTVDAMDFLAQAYRDQDVLHFIDVDGVEYEVMLWDFLDDYRVPGSAGEQREGVLRLTLLEVTISP